MLNEAEIKRALAGTFSDGGWTLLYSEAEKRGCIDGNLRPLWNIFESAMKLQEVCPWEWMSLAGVQGQLSYRLFPDGKLIALGLGDIHKLLALDDKLQAECDSLTEKEYEEHDIEFADSLALSQTKQAEQK